MRLPDAAPAERRLAPEEIVRRAKSIRRRIISQWFFLAEMRLPDAVIGFLVGSGHPLWYIYGVLLVIVTASFAWPLWSVWRSSRSLKLISSVIDRLSMLATFYLFFDALAIIVVVGTPAAYLLATRDFRGRSVVMTLCWGRSSLIRTTQRSQRSGFRSAYRSAKAMTWVRLSSKSNAISTMPLASKPITKGTLPTR